MFEMLYSGQIIRLADQHPKEAAAVIVAALVVPEFLRRYTQIQMTKIKSENDVEIARLERETAEFKYRTAKLFDVDPPAVS